MGEDLGLTGGLSVEQQLQARVAELEAQVQRLRGDPSVHQLLRPMGFNPRQAKMLVLLSQHHPISLSRQAISEAIGGTTLKGIDVLVCKTRKVLEKKHVAGTIETIHRQGYRLSVELAGWVRSKLGADLEPEDQLHLPFEAKPQ